jgi:broad specificity phosphatase PhoE
MSTAWHAIVLGFAAIGALASLITLVEQLLPDFTIGFIGRLKLGRTHRWDSVLQKVGEAETRVWVLQTWLPTLRKDLGLWRKALNRPGIAVRVLLMDQNLVPYRLRGREPVSGLTDQNVEDLSVLAAECNVGPAAKLAGRFFSNLPFGPIYVLDDCVYWGLYWAHRDSMAGPAFRSSARSVLGRALVASFEQTWSLSKPRSGLLTMPSGQSPSQPTSHRRLTDDELREQELVETTRRHSLLEVPPQDVTRILASHEGFLATLGSAETDLARHQIMTGSLHVGINGTGRDQAWQVQSLLSKVEWDHVYSSPLRRALETVRLALGPSGQAAEARDALQDRFLGIAEGFQKNSYQKAVPHLAGVDLLHSFYTSTPDAESFFDVLKRLWPLLDDAAEQVREGRRILICTHRVPLQLAHHALTPGITTSQAIQIPVASGQVRVYASAPAP